MIFVDTSAWFALFARNDRYSETVRAWLSENRAQPLVTTDFVVDELLTLLRVRSESDRALRAGSQLIGGHLASLEFVREADFHAAWDLFRAYHDKSWSFTDCTSRVVMERLGITSALAFDDHFRQFGTVSVLP